MGKPRYASARWARFAFFTLLAWSCAAVGGDITGKPAPPLTTVDLQQRTVDLADLHGQTVLLMFWATWCGPCRKEMPLVQAAYKRHRDDGFAVIAVNVSDDREDVKDYVKEMAVEFPIVLDPNGDTAERFGVVGLPTNYVIDAKGMVREEIIGGGLSADHLEDILRKPGHERRNDSP